MNTGPGVQTLAIALSCCNFTLTNPVLASSILLFSSNPELAVWCCVMHLCAILAALSLSLCVCVCVCVCTVGVSILCVEKSCAGGFLHCQIDLPSLVYAGFRFTKEGITAPQTSSVKWITDGTHTLPAPLTAPRQC